MTNNQAKSELFGGNMLNEGPVAFTRNRMPSNKAALTDSNFRDNGRVSFDKFNRSDQDQLLTAINAAYRQIYGNAHVMENERSPELEAQLCDGSLTVRDFARALAKTTFYKARFFESVAPQRGIELNIQHLLGRPPINQAEMSAHISLLASSGHDAVIDFIIDSQEYSKAFGGDTVPYKRSWKSEAGIPVNSFANMAALERSFATSDSAVGNKSQISSTLAVGKVPYIKIPAQVYASNSISSSKSGIRLDYSSAQGNKTAGIFTPLRNDIYVGFGLGQREQEVFQRNTGDSTDQINALIRATYKQVMGNPHLMEAERALSAESKFTEGYQSTREFVRAIALSPEYVKRFFETNAPYRFIELNFKHLLGRAPISQAEISLHTQTLANDGYEAEINSYVDSNEYQATFGEDTVPYMRILSEKGRSQLAFNRHLSLAEGYAASDSVLSSSALVNSIGTGGVPSGWRNTTVRINRNSAISGVSDPTKKRFRINVQAQAAAARQRSANSTYIVSGKDMSTQIKYILSRGGRIASITEIM